MISVTVPAPTVRPPSRIAKRNPLSMATGVVLAAVFAFGAYFFLIDNIINKAITRVYDIFTK